MMDRMPLPIALFLFPPIFFLRSVPVPLIECRMTGSARPVMGNGGELLWPHDSMLLAGAALPCGTSTFDGGRLVFAGEEEEEAPWVSHPTQAGGAGPG